MRIRIEGTFTKLHLLVSEYQEESSGREGFKVYIRNEKNHVIKEVIMLESGLEDNQAEIQEVNK